MHGATIKIIGNMCLYTFFFVHLCWSDVKIHHVVQHGVQQRTEDVSCVTGDPLNMMFVELVQRVKSCATCM